MKDTESTETPTSIGVASAVDVAMPTSHSESVIRDTLEALERSVSRSPVTVDDLIVVDDHSTDATVSIAERTAEEFGWGTTIVQQSTTLPEAREIAIDAVDTEWFLFLDDDVVMAESYLSALVAGVSPLAGAVQGRKVTGTKSPSKWVHYRSMRGGTHATLLRHETVSGIRIPADLVVLEDEFIRQYVENVQSKLWIFNHQAVFYHQNQLRHPLGWKEGFLAGKYGLRPGYRMVVDVPASVIGGRNPLPYCARSTGFLVGRLHRQVAHSPLGSLLEYAIGTQVAPSHPPSRGGRDEDG